MIHCSNLSNLNKCNLNEEANPWVSIGPLLNKLLMDQFGNARLWKGLGYIYEHQDLFDQAAAAYRHGFELDSTAFDLVLAWARAGLDSGSFDEAKTAIQQLHSVDPQRAYRCVSFLLSHPVWQQGLAAEAAVAMQESSSQAQKLKQASGFFGQTENVNTVPPQDPNKCKAPRKV